MQWEKWGLDSRLPGTLGVSSGRLTAPGRNRFESGLQIDFGVYASIARQWNDDKKRTIAISIKAVDVVNALFKFLLTSDSDDGVRASLADVVYGQPAARGDAHTFVPEAKGRVAQEVNGAVRVAAGTLKAQLVVFRFAGIAVPKAMGQQ